MRLGGNRIVMHRSCVMVLQGSKRTLRSHWRSLQKRLLMRLRMDLGMCDLVIGICMVSCIALSVG